MKLLQLTGIACLMMALTIAATAQDTRDPDVLFGQARHAAFEQKDYPEAIRLAQRALELTPGYTDVRVFLGRLYFWSGMTGQARDTFNQVLQQDPRQLDGRLALIDVELEGGRARQALELAEEGLEYFPNNMDLLFRKGRALELLGREEEALNVLQRVRQINPGYPHVRTLTGRLQGALLNWQAMVALAYERFNGSFDPWYLGTFELLRETTAGDFIGRVHYDRRFDQNDFQVELDAYPTLSSDLYAFVNLGYSGNTFFPEYRAGLSLYYLLPRALEAEVGFRYLHFNEQNVTIYTASIGKYFRNYWFQVRPYFVPKLDDASSLSALVNARRFFSDRDNFISLRAGFGSSPTGFNSQQDVARLNSVRFELELQQKLSPGFLFRGRVGYMREEYLAEAYRNRIIGGLNLYFRF